MEGHPIYIEVTTNCDATYNMEIFTRDTIQTVQPAVSQDHGQDLAQTSKQPDDAAAVVEKETPTEKDESYPTIQKRKHRCTECKRFTTENEEKLLRHIKKVHRGENPFNCYMCDYSTYNKCLFEEHVRIHQGIKPFNCSYCPYKSVSKKNAKKHELIHRPDNPLKCTQCDFIARHSKSLKCHMATCDGISKELVKCDQCDHTTNKTHMWYHKRSHNTGDTFSCTKCDYSVKSKSLLKTHELKKHSRKKIIKKLKTGTNSFKCKICGWQSTHKPKILLHLIHHPLQDVDEDAIDLTILRKFGILI